MGICAKVQPVTPKQVDRLGYISRLGMVSGSDATPFQTQDKKSPPLPTAVDLCADRGIHCLIWEAE
jgi:hypothetical protein